MIYLYLMAHESWGFMGSDGAFPQGGEKPHTDHNRLGFSSIRCIFVNCLLLRGTVLGDRWRQKDDFPILKAEPVNNNYINQCNSSYTTNVSESHINNETEI